MSDESPRYEPLATTTMVERGLERGTNDVPVLFRPKPHLRSPLVDQHGTDVPPPGFQTGVPGLSLRQARGFIRPAAWALVVAAPFLVLIGWQVAVVLGALAALTRDLDARFRRANISFAQGFLPFRDRYPWPQGVQEDDDVHWNWSLRPRNRHVSRP